jgi:hypothetical protein
VFGSSARTDDIRRFSTIQQELSGCYITVQQELSELYPWLSSKLNFNHRPVNSRVVRTSWYKNFVQSFIHSNRAARRVELYLSLLYQSSAGFRWLNIKIV